MKRLPTMLIWKLTQVFLDKFDIGPMYFLFMYDPVLFLEFFSRN